MRERSNSLAELLSLSSSSSDRSKRVLMLLYCCVISALSKSVVEVMAAASVAGDGGPRPQVAHRQTRGGDETARIVCKSWRQSDPGRREGFNVINYAD